MWHSLLLQICEGAVLNRYILAVLVCILFSGCVTAPQDNVKVVPAPTSRAENLNIPNVKIAVFDLAKDNVQVVPVMAKDGCESFRDIIAEKKPLAAVTGTYYDENYKPCGDILSGGKLICRGYERCGVGFTQDGCIRFVRRYGRQIDWRGCQSGIACGPKILTAGKKDIDVKRDGFTKGAEYLEACRCAIGAIDKHTLVLCAVKKGVTLDEFADILLKAGVKDAVNMDGGSMCAFYNDGDFFDVPINGVNNIIIVKNVTE